MRIYTLDDVVLFCSEDMAREYEEDEDIGEFDPEIHIDTCLDSFLKKNPKIKKLAELHSRINKLKGKIILSAHGGCDYTYYDKKKWTYFDNKKEFSIQGWVNKWDGRYGTLILHCCNPEHLEIYSKKSAVVCYNHIYSGIKQARCEGQVEIYIPKLEYVDSYIIDNEIEKMRKMLKENRTPQ